MLEIIILACLGVWNIVTLVLYARDKRLAQDKKWRISEKTLIISALLFGGIGAAIGMYGLRHKTQHTKFRILVPLGLILTLAAIAVLVYLLLT